MHMALRGAVAEEPVREAEGAGPVGDQGALAGDVEGAETGAGEYLGYVGEALRVPFWVECKDGIASTSVVVCERHVINRGGLRALYKSVLSQREQVLRVL